MEMYNQISAPRNGDNGKWRQFKINKGQANNAFNYNELIFMGWKFFLFLE